ncbi:ROK family protein [Nocardioides sp. HDW12B]|uniref:ROK family transcriptional regulator n=1 Tax=Nocardioides sp. HDW12B TaxID=2714939 RepID=UPI001409B561|nr:ROK family protein [Nocardioides sp. HDW12B]QIK68194.1 ROK family protein [Nocardioides sp. HDW12B]
MILLARGRFGATATRVMEPLRVHGPMARETIAARSGLSLATVARTVATLQGERLVRERPDLVEPGTVGRPRVPVEIDPDHFAVLGVHVGRKATTVSLVDLAGRPAAHVRVATPAGSRTRGSAVSPVAVDALVATVSKAAAGLVARHSHRTLLSAGVVAPWFDLGLAQEDVRRRVELATGLETAAADHVAAVAAAEYLAREEALSGCTMYLYARDTAGFALANDLPRRTEISRVGRLSHFPTGSDALCRCGATGCLEATISDEAVAAQARVLGVIGSGDIDALRAAAYGGNGRAHNLLADRARVLGRTAAVVRDMVDPDRVVLVGQAFTGYPPVLDDVVAALHDRSVLGPVDVSFTRFGAGVQAAAAGAVALVPVYEDPLALVRADGAVANL